MVEIPRNAPIIIGFGAKSRSGKDSCVKHIIEKFGQDYDIRRYAFADELKKDVEQIGIARLAFKLGVKLDPKPDMSDPLCQSEWGKQSALLQAWGEFCRKHDSFVWVRKVREQIERDQPQFALISDMRYKNEFLYVKAFRGYTVRVTRQGFVDLSRDPHHISEVDLDGWQFDYEISVADGQLEQLKADAEEVFKLIVAAQEPVKPEVDDDYVVPAT